jgi:hypothetical protein
MGGKIPPLIKTAVIMKWLTGMSRDNIAINNQLSSGSVSCIIQEFKNKEIPDMDLLRRVAVSLKRDNLDLVQFASSMRLKKQLDNLGLSEERIEKFLEHLAVFFYKNDDINVEKFLLQLESVYEMGVILDVSIYDLVEEIDNKKAELSELEYKKSILKQQVEEEKSKFVNTLKNTEKYIAARRYATMNPKSSLA